MIALYRPACSLQAFGWASLTRLVASLSLLCPVCAGDHKIKLSISHALSQSTKLCVFEERVLEIVASTKDLPESLATTGVHGAAGLMLAAYCRLMRLYDGA